MTIQAPLNTHHLFISLLILFFSTNVFAKKNPPSIKYFQTDVRYEYRTKLLRLALKKTAPTDGTLSLEALPYKVTLKRGLAFLADGGVDVVSLATNKIREDRFLPIRIPILRGLLGYRVFLIHRDNADIFTNVKTINHLTDNFTAGFGIHWADYNILKANNIPVETSAIYKNLFDMLIAGRFDYFPRGINEAWSEITEFKGKHPDLDVEQNIALYYPYPTYFFVRKNNHPLAKRIKRGLKIAQEDGSFKQLFLDYHQKIIEQANLSNRLMFTLHNPTLPTNTPQIDTRWWLTAKTKGN